MTNNLYREEILEHYKNPLNVGKLNNFDISSKQHNPFCGDEIEIFIKFEVLSEDTSIILSQRCKIKEVSFLGNGCAISIASMSLLTEYIKEKTVEQLTKFSELDMLYLLGIEVSETRKKCALLGWAILKDCLKHSTI